MGILNDGLRAFARQVCSLFLDIVNKDRRYQKRFQESLLASYIEERKRKSPRFQEFVTTLYELDFIDKSTFLKLMED